MSPDDALTPDRPRRDVPWLVGIGLLVIAVAAQGVRAGNEGWLANGDDAFWAIMARSVFSAHPPLLGSSSSGGLVAGEAFHHPGPLGFYLLAPFVGALGSVGLAVGAAVLNAAALATAALAARRHLGRAVGWAALATGAVLAHTMGNEVLVDPWNPHIATLPIWAALWCAAAVVASRAARRSPMVPALGVAWSSLAFQSHLSFAPFAVVLGTVILGAVARDANATRGPRTPIAATLATGLAANSLPLVQQLFGAGHGNLTTALAGSGDQGDTIGADGASWLVSHTIGQPASWWRGAWRDAVTAFGPDATSPGPNWPVWLLLAVIVVVGAWVWRNPRPGHAALLALAAGLVAAELAVAANVPVRFGGIPMVLGRWTWPINLFVQTIVVVVAVAAVAGDRIRPAVPTVIASAIVAACVVGLIPWRDDGSGAPAATRAAARQLIDGARADLDGLDRPLVTVADGFGPASILAAVIDHLDERGVDYRLDDATLLVQAGTHHRARGDETAEVTVRLVQSPDGTVPACDPRTTATAADGSRYVLCIGAPPRR